MKKKKLKLTEVDRDRLCNMDIEAELDRFFGEQSFKYPKDWVFKKS